MERSKLFILPPPFTRPGWDNLTVRAKRIAMRDYNKLLESRRMKPIDFIPSLEEQYPDGFSAETINPSFPGLGLEFARQEALYKRNPDSIQYADENLRYFLTTKTPPSASHFVKIVSTTERPGLPTYSDVYPSQVERPKQSRPRTSSSSSNEGSPSRSRVSEAEKESPPAKREKTDVPTTAATSGTTHTTAPAYTFPAPTTAAATSTTSTVPAQAVPTQVTPAVNQVNPTQNMELPGTGHQSVSQGGGKTGPNQFPKNSNPPVAYERTYKKSYKFQVVGNGPAVITAESTVNEKKVKYKMLATNLRELPVHILQAYMTPGEIAEILASKGTIATNCKVVVGKKSTQAAFETNASESSQAVLNYNKSYKHVIGLNRHPWAYNRAVTTYKNGAPETLATPINWNDILSNAWTGSSNYPAAITRSCITCPNVFCQVKPNDSTTTQKDMGWFDHSKFVQELDDDNPEIIIYNHSFTYAPINQPWPSEYVTYPILTTATGADTGSISSTISIAGGTRKGRKCIMKSDTHSFGKVPRFTSMTAAEISTFKPVANITFAADDIIEKAQYCTPDLLSSYATTSVQPSLHIGIGEVPAVKPFRTISTAADCVATAFVPQVGELWITFEMHTVTYRGPSMRTLSSTPTYAPEKAPMTSLASWPKAVNDNRIFGGLMCD